MTDPVLEEFIERFAPDGDLPRLLRVTMAAYNSAPDVLTQTFIGGLIALLQVQIKATQH